MTRQPTPSALPGSDRVGPASEVWSSDAWRWEAIRWMDAALERRGIARVPTTPLQPRLRPWSTVLVADTTDQGRVWFKAGLPEMTPEAALLRVLRSIAPDAVPVVWADDVERGWLLMPDQGPTLRDAQRADDAVNHMSAVVRRYARLQRSSASVVDAMRAAGVPEMSPREIARRWQGLGLRPDTTCEVRQAAQRLDDLGLPLTIQHDDLHAGNVFADGSTRGSHDARIFDWGDATISHPLCSLLVPLKQVSEGLEAGVAEAARERVLRAYLSGWGDVVPSSALADALDDALLLARVGRVFTWQRALTRATPAERRQWGRHGRTLIAEINAACGHEPDLVTPG